MNQQEKKQVQRSQSLKNVSRHSSLIIANNQKLTKKNISCVVYQILAKTELGQKLIKQNCSNISQQVLKALESKQQGFKKQQSPQKKTFNNISRRVNDTITVLASCKMIKNLPKQEIKKNQQLQRFQSKKEKEQIHIKNINFQNLQNEIEQVQERIKMKRMNLDQKERVYHMLHQFFQRNKQLIERIEQNQNSQEATFSFPITIVLTQPQMKIQHEENSISILNSKEINNISDFNIMNYLIQQYANQKQLFEVIQFGN